MTDLVVLVQSPFWAPLALALRDRLGATLVYDCLDAHEAFGKNRPGLFGEAEAALARDADLVTATSEPLRRRLEATGAAPRLLPNACDYERFAAVPPPPHPGGEPTVGYVGAVDEWFDMPLLETLAARRPGWTFEIVGGVEDAAVRAARRENVRFRGERPYAEMPEWHARFDVEIIPFRLSPLTHATDPVKLYEAAACGRPAVATPMEALRPFAERGLVRLADGADAFAAAIEAAAAGASADAPRLRAFALENTWDVRAEALDGWLTAAGTHGNVNAREP
jgi:glycosyltransferase involved in cell wall biosynthesis